MELNIIAMATEHLVVRRDWINISESFNIFAPKFIYFYVDTITVYHSILNSNNFCKRNLADNVIGEIKSSES